MRRIVALVVMLVTMMPFVAGAVTQGKVSAKGSDYKSMELFADGNCKQACVVLGRVAVTKSTTIGSCEDKLRKYAKKEYGADAILKFKAGNINFFCEGIAVRWAGEGEEGVMKLTDDMSIPVLKGKY